MTVRVSRASDVPVGQWLGGGGSTRELARWPEREGAFGWRVSVADVDRSGPFSTLHGIDRVLVFCQGPTMKLTVDGVCRTLTRWEPVAFAGEEAVTCDVPEGPTRDLNVMTHRGSWKANVSLFRGVRNLLAVAGDVRVVVGLDGKCLLEAEGDVVELGVFDAAVCSDGVFSVDAVDGWAADIWLRPTEARE